MTNGDRKTEKQEGIQELLDLLHAHDVLLVGEPGFWEATETFLKKNNIKRKRHTATQKELSQYLEGVGIGVATRKREKEGQG